MTDQQGRLRVRAAVFACIVVAVLVVDQSSKIWAQSALSDGRIIPVVPGLLSFQLLYNPGMSLGLFSSMTWLISLLAIAATVLLAVLALRTASLRWNVVFSFACAGAFGNVIDRVVNADGFLNGEVVDFIDYGWSVGNVADICLVGAGIAAVVLIILDEPLGLSDRRDADERNIDPSAGDSGAGAVGGYDAVNGAAGASSLDDARGPRR